MAAFEPPWIAPPHHHHHHSSMTSPSSSSGAPSLPTLDPNPPTIAAFSPSTPSTILRRSTLQVHQKSPLLLATPPRITQTLSLSHSWLRILNFALSLVTWTSSDPWSSFLLLAAFLGAGLYGDSAVLWAGPVVVTAALVGIMWGRRFWDGRGMTVVERSVTLEEILSELSEVNTRIGILIEPWSGLLRTLATQREIKGPRGSSPRWTTRPALTRLAGRMLIIATPLWAGFAALGIVTGRRILIMVGTIVLTWHSRPAKVSRTVLWRSRWIRWFSELSTGLELHPPSPAPYPLPTPAPPLPQRTNSSASLKAGKPTPLDAGATTTRSTQPGVKFTFVIWENQRRWLGIGWTGVMLPNERANWTDEHLNPCGPPGEFQLPETPEGSGVRWRWVKGEEWEVEGGEKGNGTRRRAGSGAGKSGGVGGVTAKERLQEVMDRTGGPGEGGEGWWYYNNKWLDGRRAIDGWGKYTRRRKWYRRAELVEGEPTPDPSPVPSRTSTPPPEYAPTVMSTAGTGSSASSVKPGRMEEGGYDMETGETGGADWEERKPMIKITDVDSDDPDHERVVAELEEESGSERKDANGKKVPPPLPKRRVVV